MVTKPLKAFVTFTSVFAISVTLALIWGEARTMDDSDVPGRPVRFAAWNVEQADVDSLIELETQEKIDFDFIVDFTAPNDILEADVTILAASQDPDFIENISGFLNI